MRSQEETEKHKVTKSDVVDFETFSQAVKEEFGVSLNKQIVEKVRKELQPLSTVVLDSSLQYEGFEKDIERIGYKIKLATNLVEIETLLLEAVGRTIGDEKEELKEKLRLNAFSLAMSYLCSVELVAGTIIDFSIMLLVSKGYSLHLEPDYDHRYTRHVRSLDDIESPTLPLSVKLDFLHSNGLTFYSKWINRPLRNAIAHLNFDIDDSGNFFILKKGRSKKKVDLIRIFDHFKDYFYATAALLVEIIRKARKANPKV